jgi:membrane fusion protein, adhesin transport system
MALKLSLPQPGAWLAALAQRAPWRRKVVAEPVDGSGASTPRPVLSATTTATTTATPTGERPQVGIRRNGPGRRATDQVRQEPAMGLEADLAALRRGERRTPGTAMPGDDAATPGLAMPRAGERGWGAFSAERDYKDDVRPDRIGAVRPGDEDFLQGLKAARAVEATPGAMWPLWLLALIVASALTWAALAKVDVITRAEGKVVPDAREQVIASLEGGILRALHVREGDLVEAGQELAQLDPTRFAAVQNEGQTRQIALRGTAARLSAEANGRPLSFPNDVRQDASVVAAETEAYEARRRLLEEAAAVIRRSIGLIDRELGTAESLASQGLMSDVEVMRLRRQRNDLQMQVQERVNRFRQDASTELLRVRTELAQLGEQQVAKDDQLRRTTLTSPLRGIVKNIRIGTLGGIVGPGAPILEIVPLTDRVLIEARIKPADIGFVRAGLQAEVKLSAYDYYTYGGLKGTIEYLSPDALGDERAAGPDNTYYRARIRTDAATLRGKDDKPLPVLPGMTAAIEIRTGDRSVMHFLLKPMMKGTEAFRER